MSAVAPRAGDHYPAPEQLVRLHPFLRRLMDAATDYDAAALGGEMTTAVDFVTWLALDVERAVEHQTPQWVRDRISDAQIRRHAQRKR